MGGIDEDFRLALDYVSCPRAKVESLFRLYPTLLTVKWSHDITHIDTFLHIIKYTDHLVVQNEQVPYTLVAEWLRVRLRVRMVRGSTLTVGNFLSLENLNVIIRAIN